MKNHVLLENAKVYKAPEIIETPENCTFNIDKGYWINNESGEIMMRSDDPKKPTSKKFDRETGEDQKGE